MRSDLVRRGGGTGPAAADVLVVGAGPAGMAAAVEAADAGAHVVVLDADARPGGQFWRHGAGGPGPYHHDVRGWSELERPWSAAVRAGRIAHLAGARVWRLDPGPPPAVHAVRGHRDGERGSVFVAPAVVVATGAHDRVLPFPGWDLPGVLTPGAVQTLLKQDGVTAGREVVVGGSGPFLLPVAAGLLQAGSRVVALVEAADGLGWSSVWRALPALRERAPEAVAYLARLARAGVRPRLRHAVVHVHGTDRVEAATISRLDEAGRPVPGTQRRVVCDAVAVGWGFSARAELALQAGACPATGPDGGIAVAADGSGRTAVPGLLVAGELTGSGGASLAVTTGRLAGAAAAAHALTSTAPPPSPALVRRRRRLETFAEVMHHAHPVPSGWTAWLDDDTVVCRCEEVPVRALHEAVDALGATEPRTAKLLTRCGMGWCQGRMCGEALTAIVAARSGRPGRPAAVARLASRPVAVPVTFASLTDPQLTDPQQADPRQADPRQADPRQADPRQADPRQADPRQEDLT